MVERGERNMEIDGARWRALLAEERDAGADLRAATTQSNEAQFLAMKARSDRDRAAGDRTLHFHDKDIAAQARLVLHECEKRLAVAEREAERVQQRTSELSRRRNEAARLVRACRDWARSQNLTLPDDDGAAIVQATVPTAAKYTRDFISQAEIDADAAAQTAPSTGRLGASAPARPAVSDLPPGVVSTVLGKIRERIGGAP
jgi:hypothetical protein